MFKSNMNHKIISFLETIEQENNITIIFACEAGSRNWGLNSDQSDYDVRYIYVHNSVFWYISTDNKKDTLSHNINNDIDVETSGWDIVKAVKELKVSNPSIIEWMQSSCIYINKHRFQESIVSIISQLHNNKSLMFHYNRMLCSNLKSFFDNADKVLRKKYFYILMPALNLMYLLENDTCVICSNFELLLESCTVPIEVKECILTLVANKKAGKCYDIEEKIPLLDSWVSSIRTLVDNKLFVKNTKNTSHSPSGAPYYYNLSKSHYTNMMKCVTENGNTIKKKVFLDMICDMMKTISLINCRSLTKRDINCKISMLFQYCANDLPENIKLEICSVIEDKSEFTTISLNVREWYNITIKNLKNEIHSIENTNRNINETIKSTIYCDTLKTLDIGVFDQIIQTYMKYFQIEWREEHS